MSSVRLRPFGEIKAGNSKMGLATRAHFQVIINTSDVVELADFLELVYNTQVKIVFTDDGYKLFFHSAPHRTESGVQFVARLFQAELVKVDTWF